MNFDSIRSYHVKKQIDTSIPHAKTILIKYFCIKKKIEVETRWQINQPSFFRFTFSTYFLFYSAHFHLHIYI